jgi:hypothetical protein
VDQIRDQRTNITFPKLEALELQAIEERNMLHGTVQEFRSYVAESRHKLTLSRNVREHFLAVSLASSIIALLSGYRLAGMFVSSKLRDRSCQ